MFTFPTTLVRDMARELVERIPSVDRLRFTASGSEAVMFAVRLARLYTGKTKIAKMQGGYHGTFDPLWTGVAGEPGSLAGQPDVPGMIPGVKNNLVILPFNHAERSVQIIEENAKDLAIVCVEPVMGSTGMLPPKPGYLEALRDVTRKHNIVLLFDEMISFSIARGGAQEFYGVTPDMTTTGKAIGGGMPLAIFGGRADIMERADLWTRDGKPKAVQMATYGAHPLSLAAGHAVLQQLTPEVYTKLHRLGDRLRDGLKGLFARREYPMQVSGVGHLFGIYCSRVPVWDYATVQASNLQMITTDITLGMLARGYFMSHRARGCLSAAMSEEHVDGFIDAMDQTLKEVDWPAV
ncbi:MAG: aminotransferase class III-fold pyridoxal phosphate-dependent enzyme [Chloroflexi bacterium]|nr:aminotransferase class III-fold pyridoxal phosphate-dependent enzyme [Chloroflexota bacterium]